MNQHINPSNLPASQQAAPVARLAPSRLPIVQSVATEFQVTADQWRVLVDQVFPNAKTVEAIGMALAYCRTRKLDIFKKPVHIVPMWSSALKRMVETVWPGIAEIRTTASRTGQYAGIDDVEFGPMIEREFTGTREIYDRGQGTGRYEEVRKLVRYPEWARVVVYRMIEGQRCPFVARVYWEEAYATAGRDTEVPNEMWGKRPRGQLDKCVEAAALRKAFPEELGNTYAAEEMEGRTIDIASASDPLGLTGGSTEAKRSGPPSPPKPPADLFHEEDEAKARPAEAEPEFVNPEDVFAEAERLLGDLSDVESVRAEFDSELAHYQERLTPMDWDRLETIRDKHVARAE